MTVTSTPSELAAAAARASALGDHPRAAQLYQEAADNSKNTAFTSGAISTNAGYVTSAATEVKTSHVQQVKGHDGKTLTG